MAEFIHQEGCGIVGNGCTKSIDINIPTPAQLEALGAAFQRVGHAARHTEDAMRYLFPAAARQQFDRRERPLTRRTDSTYFGRKRRARRARGRRIEARREMPQMVTLNLGQAYGKSKALRQQLELARKIHVPVFDEVHRFPVMTDEQAQAYREFTVEQWAAARRTMSRQQEAQADD